MVSIKKCLEKENKKRNKKTKTKSIATTMSDGSYLSNNAHTHTHIHTHTHARTQTHAQKAQKPAVESLVRGISRLRVSEAEREYERVCKVKDSHRDNTE